MNQIELIIHCQSAEPESCLSRFGSDVSALLSNYLNATTDIIRVRGTIKEGTDQHLNIILRSLDNSITVDLSTVSDNNIVQLTVNGKIKEINHIVKQDVFTPLIRPYLAPQKSDLDILLMQEEELQFSSFTSKNALELIIIFNEMSIAPLSISIYRESDQTVIAQYVSDRKSKRNVSIAAGKRNMSLKCGHSSLYAYCNNSLTGSYEEYRKQAPQYICGAGAFPIRVNDEVVATIAISGLKEGADHDIIIDVLNKYLHKGIPYSTSLVI